MYIPREDGIEYWTTRLEEEILDTDMSDLMMTMHFRPDELSIGDILMIDRHLRNMISYTKLLRDAVNQPPDPTPITKEQIRNIFRRK